MRSVARRIWTMAEPRTVIAVVALVGALLGGMLGVLLPPKPTHFSATATVVMSPDSTRTGGEVTAFWSVLNRGQVTRQAASLFQDLRWIPDIAEAVDIPEDDVKLESYMLPETMIVKVTVITTSLESADAALNELLITALPAVERLVPPFAVRVVWPLPHSAIPLPVPSTSQAGASGALWGGLAGFVVAAAYGRWNRLNQTLHVPAELTVSSGR